MTSELTPQQKADAAAGDVNILSTIMLIGSSVFAGVNWWLGTLGWIAAVATVLSTLTTSVGLWQRSDVAAAFVKVGFGVSGLVTPVLAIAGVVLGLFGITWGWALLAGALLYFAFSLLGLEIIERAHETGVVGKF